MSIDTLPTSTSSPQQPQSHKAKRRSRNHSRDVDNHNGDEQTITTSTTTTNIVVAPSRPIPRSMAPAPSSTPLRLLICSIGNPAPYTNTLHSAAHSVLRALGASLSHPPFQPSRPHGNGLLSAGPTYTLYQSPSLMNASGPAIARAWRAFLAPQHGDVPAALVILHDELELPLGAVRARPGANSPKGHNGLKSIRDKMPGVEYTRIGVGIGRPVSREPEVVAAYVLRKMTAEERGRIEGCVGEVERELRRLRGE